MTPTELLLSRLTDAKRNGDGWKARCPAHDDSDPSLSIRAGQDGRALVKCFAGCTAEAVVTALGLTLRDLMPTSDFAHHHRPNAGGESRQRGTGDEGVRVFATAAEAVAKLEVRHGPRSSLRTYLDKDGTPVGVIVRWNIPGGKRIKPVSRTERGWVIGGIPVPRPLYHLPELAPAQVVYIAEGEPAADALCSLGLIATTSPHGARSAKQADWTPLADKQLRLLPDNDDAGEQYEQDVTDCVRRAASTAVLKIVRLPGLPPSGDAVDFIAARRAAGLDDAAIRAEIDALAEAAPVVEPDISAPPLLEYVPFPLGALPNRVRTFVEAIAAATGTDGAFAALAALVVLAGCIGNRAAIILKSGWVEPAVLWGALVGRSGSTKSPVLKLVMRAVFELYKIERDVFAEKQREYVIEVARYEVSLQVWKQSQKTGPATDPPLEPTAPIENRVAVSDITIEKLGCLSEENPLGLLLQRDELAAWAGGFDRYAAGGKGSDQPAWLSMYDAASITIDRKSGKGTIFVERAAVSVLGGIQPGTLKRLFGVAEREAGLLARLLLAYPPEQPGLWTDAGLLDDVAMDWRGLLSGLLELQPGRDEVGGLRPRLLPLAHDAKSLWVKWHNNHVRETVEIGDDDLAAHFAKLKGACPRIALVLACVEVASGGQATLNISADAMQRAIAITEWFKHEARRVYQVLGESREEREQRLLVEWIERRDGSVTVRDLTHGLRRFRNQPDLARAALDALVEAGYGRWIQPAPSAAGGCPSPRFELSTGVTVTKTPIPDSANEGSGDGDSAESPNTPIDVEKPQTDAGDGDASAARDDEPPEASSDEWGEV